MFPKNTVIAVSGTHKGYTQAKIERLITQNGGAFTKTVDADTTYLFTTSVDIDKMTQKVSLAIEHDIPMLSLDWLLQSIEKKKVLPTTGFALNGPSSTQNDSTAAATVTADSNDTSKKRPSRAMKKEESDVAMLDLADATDNVPRKRPSRAAKKEDPEPEEPAAKKAKKTVAVGKKKKGAAGDGAVKSDDSEEAEDTPVMKKVVRKGKAPVDEMCPLAGTHHVYVDQNGILWDAALNQTDIGRNNNKFYYCQLLESDVNPSYAVFCRWGRVGERGQNKMYASGVGLNEAQYVFDKQMKAKSGQSWANRRLATGGAKKYAFLERNYEEDDDDAASSKDEDGNEIKPLVSQIAKPLQELMQLIFNASFMQQSMAELSYDSNKLPLGKLSKDTISQGYLALKQIAEALNDNTGALATFNQHGNSLAEILVSLTNRYYTVIPHNFGRNIPPIIDTPVKLKQETELVQNLTDMKISSQIIAQSKGSDADVHPLDKQLESLGLDEMLALDKSTNEFKFLEGYVKKTHGRTHSHLKLNVEEIFRVRRSVEEDRWCDKGWDKYDKDNRMLLWHGSRTTNFSGILSQGLRIAPPEAPATGYMFDKGIYLADIVSKSAGYCCHRISNNTGLLLLCEAQLGNPMYEQGDADSRAAQNSKKAGAIATKGVGKTAPTKWEDASIIHPQLKGVKMPKVSGNEADITGNTKDPKAQWLQYNEYITYDVSQVKLRYLFRVKFL